jgi:hypothetical protein
LPKAVQKVAQNCPKIAQICTLLNKKILPIKIYGKSCEYLGKLRSKFVPYYGEFFAGFFLKKLRRNHWAI